MTGHMQYVIIVEIHLIHLFHYFILKFCNSTIINNGRVVYIWFYSLCNNLIIKISNQWLKDTSFYHVMRFKACDKKLPCPLSHITNGGRNYHKHSHICIQEDTEWYCLWKRWKSKRVIQETALQAQIAMLYSCPISKGNRRRTVILSYT